MLTVLDTSDGSRTLHSNDFRESFHSIHGALTEARHVFMNGTGIHDLLAHAPVVRVLEVGFGTGLNFLLTASIARANTAELQYTGLDLAVPPNELLSPLNYERIEGLQEMTTAWLRWRSSLPYPVPDGTYAHELAPRCRLQLIIGDATKQILPARNYDVVFLDGFSPKVNPRLWTPAFFKTLSRATKPLGALATYSSAGHVRRALEEAHFDVSRRPGPPGKREVLVAKNLRHHWNT